MYSLRGFSTGTCGCQQAIVCDCWDGESSTDACCGDSFVGIFIEHGQINSIDVSGVPILRLLRQTQESGELSILCIGENTTLEQRHSLATAFCGGYGGILSQLARLYKTPTIKIVPINYVLHSNGRASIKLGDSLLRDSASQTTFSYDCE